MRILKLVFVLSFCCTSLIAQRTVDFNKQWNVVDHKVFTPNICTSIYSFRKDTTINSHKYFELFVKRDSTNSNNWESTNSFLREDSLNRIYILDNNEDKLIYDFNLNIKDSIIIDYKNTECEMTVVTVDSIELLNGVYRKRIRLIRSDDPDPFQPWYGFKDWVQGIGSLTSLLHYAESCFTDYPFDLLCFFENGVLTYASPSNSSCFITPIANLEIESTIVLYPNPANDILNIRTNIDNIFSTIYSLDGKQISNSSAKQIDISHLRKGIYFIQMVTKDKKITKKIIVN